MESMSVITHQLNQLGFVLEPYKSEDESGLYKIFKEVVDAGNLFPYESSSTQEFKRQFFGPDTLIYVCRSANNEIVGGFYIKANYSGRCRHIANAAYMILGSYRGKGLGSLLIKASLHIARELGFRAMQYNMVLSQNTLAIKLYKKLGFDIVGTIPEAIRNTDNTYQDGYVMYKKLDTIRSKL